MNASQKEIIKGYLKTVKDGPAAKRAMSVLLLDVGMDVSVTGYTIKHAQRLNRDFVTTGVTVFDDKRRSNRERVLNKREREDILKVLQASLPSEVIPGWPDAGWSTSALAHYILQQTGKKYKSKTSHYLLFKEAKFSFHCPGKSYEKTEGGKNCRVEKAATRRTQYPSACMERSRYCYSVRRRNGAYQPDDHSEDLVTSGTVSAYHRIERYMATAQHLWLFEPQRRKTTRLHDGMADYVHHRRNFGETPRHIPKKKTASRLGQLRLAPWLQGSPLD